MRPARSLRAFPGHNDGHVLSRIDAQPAGQHGPPASCACRYPPRLRRSGGRLPSTLALSGAYLPIMPRLKFAIVSLLLSCVALSAYSAGHEAADRATFAELYGRLKVAMNSRDQTAVAAMLASGFQSEDASGKVQSSEEMLAGLATLTPNPNKKTQTTVVSVAVSGTTATVVQRYQMNTTKLGADGSTKSVELVAVSDDVWSRSGDSWKLLRTVTRQMDYSIDGQVVVHKSRGAQ